MIELLLKNEYRGLFLHCISCNNFNIMLTVYFRCFDETKST